MTPGFDVQRKPPYKRAGAALVLIVAATTALAWFQFRGVLTSSTHLTLLSDRSGLVMEPGAKVTYNGVEVGQVTSVEEVDVAGRPQAELTLKVNPRYIELMPANVDAAIQATTVFGNKYISLSSPERPAAERVSPHQPIRVASVTTEFNTVFETVFELAEIVDPVRLNQILSAAATALDGNGDQFGEAVIAANRILADLNGQIPQINHDLVRFADLAQIYADGSPDLVGFLRNAVTTARTLNDQQSNLNAALMASTGLAETGTDIFERGTPYLVRGTQDLIPTSRLLDDYHAEILCTLRNYKEVAPDVGDALGGGNGYSLAAAGTLTGAANPYIYPDNLPRINARGGPLGKPGCWAPLSRYLWPAPYLVMDTGASIAPYNHLEFGQPLLNDYVWGRQFGEYTINP